MEILFAKCKISHSKNNIKTALVHSFLLTSKIHPNIRILERHLGNENNHDKSGKRNDRITQKYSNIKYTQRIINYAKSNIIISSRCCY